MSYSRYIKITTIIFFLIVLIIKLLSRYKSWEIPSKSKVIAFSPNGKMIAVTSGERVTHRISSNHSINGAFPK